MAAFGNGWTVEKRGREGSRDEIRIPDLSDGLAAGLNHEGRGREKCVDTSSRQGGEAGRGGVG